MLSLTRLRELDLHAPTQAGRRAHVSAASGLVLAGEWLYVVADDELHLGAFTAAGNAAGSLVRLFAGSLPDNAIARKAAKPDLEALTPLSPRAAPPDGALLALGSASARGRERGALVPLAADGAIAGPARVLDLSRLAAALRGRLGEVNIEGAVEHGDELVLLQRGHRGGARNALVSLPLAAVLDPGIEPVPAVREIDLATSGGVPLGFTDGALLPDGSIAFTAIAEDTASSYDDGPCVGAAVGVIGGDGGLRRLEWLERPAKIEGIVARVAGSRVRLLLVTDPDDAAVPATLYAAALSGYPFRAA